MDKRNEYQQYYNRWEGGIGNNLLQGTYTTYEEV